MNYLYVELKKQKKSKIIILSICFIFISIFIGTSIFYSNKDIMNKENYSLLLWGQNSFYYSNLLSPILCGIISSIILAIDINKKNFRRIKSVGIKLYKIILSKIMIIILYSLMIQTLFFIGFVISSKIININIELNELILFLKWAFLGSLGLCSIMSISMYIMILTKSFTSTIGINVAGTIISFFILFINENISKFFPFSLVVVGMRARSLIDMKFFELKNFLFINLFVILIFTILSIFSINKNLE